MYKFNFITLKYCVMQYLVVRVTPHITDNIARVSTSQYHSFKFSMSDPAIIELLLPLQNQFVALQLDSDLHENHTLFIGPDLASCLGVKSDDEVIFKKMNNVPKATIVIASPETADDYEIILTNQKLVENIVLRQNVLAYKGMRLFVHIGMLTVKLVVNLVNGESDTPGSCYQMVDGTELAIEAKIRKSMEERQPQPVIFSNLTLHDPDSVVPLLEYCSILKNVETRKYVFIDMKTAMAHGWADGDLISAVPLLEVSNLCIQSFPKESQNPVHKLEGVQSSELVKRLALSFTVAVIKKEKRFLPQDTCVCFAFEPSCPLYLFPGTSHSSKMKSVGCASPWIHLLNFPTKAKVDLIAGLPSIKLFDFTSVWADGTKGYSITQNCVLLGPRGSGKTATLNYIKRVVPSVLVDGIELKVLRPSERIAKLKSAFMTCSLSRATLLIDNFDGILFHNAKQVDPDEDENMVHLALVLRSLFTMQENARKFSIIASQQESSIVAPSVLQHTLQHIFPKQLKIHELPPENAMQLLFEKVPALLGISSDIHSYTVSYLANFTPGDVVSLAAIISRSIERQQESVLDVFRFACAAFCPIARENLTILQNANKKVLTVEGAVAGMELVKKKLQSLILLPIQNPSKFASLTIKLSRGILLCGPSGCGKTYFARKFIEANGIRCISVNGPEMLQKYIGSSEAKVRDVFEQAQRISPSVIFIDEIDACVPQRGSDHTGITDRVVNQFLCEMDGVEDREGVYVICATSRPEIIDKALLRPGRIDTILHCALPSLSERREALLHFQRQPEYLLEKSIDAEEYAVRMEDWSYADIHSAFERSLDETIANLLGSYISLDDVKTVEDSTEQQIELVTRGNLSVTEANKRLDYCRELIPSKVSTKEQSIPDPVITLECFDSVVRSMQPSVKKDDSDRISTFVAKKNSFAIPGQRMALI